MTNAQGMTNSQHPKRSFIWSLVIGTSLVIGHWSLVIFLTGCRSPDKVNVQLRKDKQQLEEQIAGLQQQLQAANARVSGFEAQRGSLPTLPQDRLDKLFTVHGIKLGRLTGGDPSNDKGADEGLKVYLSPVDETGEALKATGAVEIEAFDLSLGGDNRIGHWAIDSASLRARWRSLGSFRTFVIECPWQKRPQHSKLAVKVTFHDELTGRVYEQIQEVNVKIAATQPSTRTANSR